MIHPLPTSHAQNQQMEQKHMTMVEKVAKALFLAEYGPDQEPGPGEMELMHRLARAAIIAMREPTEEMIYHKDNKTLRRSIIGIYKAMIDGALSSVPATSDPSGIDMPDMG